LHIAEHNFDIDDHNAEDNEAKRVEHAEYRSFVISTVFSDAVSALAAATHNPF